MKIDDFRAAVEAGLALYVRVVPVPLEAHWCVDVLIKDSLRPGSRSDTLTGDGDSTHLLRFSSLDDCARFLHDCNVRSFVVNLDDAVSFVSVALAASDEESTGLAGKPAGGSSSSGNPVGRAGDLG